ncbi:hypothetical protein AMJ86_10500 [bacterium SM23_57]|nr:MAG: hypothetical protein AMJ86_10500 [bacterium SM23_57]
MSISLQIILLLWLLASLGIHTWKGGTIFGVKLGFLLGGSMFLGLFSISTLTWQYLFGWMSGQILEMAIAGEVIGAGLIATSLKPILIRVIAVFILLVVLTIAMQTLGLAPRLK